jgi:MFS family permease
MVNPAPAVLPSNESDARPWYRQLNGYHWLVLIVATMAWSFDCLNQQIFNLARVPAMADLLGVTTEDPRVALFGGYATSALLIGWATGGIIFGIMADRAGRARTLVVMILAYSLFTGLCGLSQAPWQYIAACFITGMGCGGIFPIGCTLVAESLPDATRSAALGSLQAFSAVGNVGAGFLWLGVLQLHSQGTIHNDWQWLFGIGILPALLSIIVIRRIREPDAWLRAAADAKAGRSKSGSIAELFGDSRWRRRAIVGMMLAASGVIGLWGIGVFSNDLTQSFIGENFDRAQREHLEDARDRAFVAQAVQSSAALDKVKDKVGPNALLGKDARDNDVKGVYEAALILAKAQKPVSPEAALAALDADDPARKTQPEKQTPEQRTRRAEWLRQAGNKSTAEEYVAGITTRQDLRRLTQRRWAGVTLIMFNIGAFFGAYLFGRVARHLGRRIMFAMGFAAAAATTAAVFKCLSAPQDIFWMVPLMGMAQFTVFVGYAIYFPELFPTRLRSTGSSFCYNVARYVAALGPQALVFLKNEVFKNPEHPVEAFRNAGVAMCGCYLLGLIALIFAPETKGQRLPE